MFPKLSIPLYENDSDGGGDNKTINVYHTPFKLLYPETENMHRYVIPSINSKIVEYHCTCQTLCSEKNIQQVMKNQLHIMRHQEKQ